MFTLFLYCNFLVLLSTTVCSQYINKQNVNLADDTLTDYSFLSKYYYTKSKNYLKRRYRIRHWIPMFIGTPCSVKSVNDVTNPYTRLYNFIYGFHYLGDDIFRTLECNLSKQPWYIYSSLQFAEFLQYNSIQFVPLQSSFKHQNQHQSQHACYQAYLLRFQG